MEQFTLEREGQIDFFNRFLPRINPALQLEDLLEDNNDGVLYGNLMEFKLNVSDLNTVLFQCIKYLSALRIKGKPVPAHIVIVDLNAEKAWVYDACDYLDRIEHVYIGAASKNNKGFVGGPFKKKFEYENPVDAEGLIEVLKSQDYTKIHLDEDCIVGWATSFYKAVPTARKEDFIGDEKGKYKKIGEIRAPKLFKDYIFPYQEHSNVKFNYLMDKLNDLRLQKNLGAFYTPELYVEKAVELVRQAIARVPKGNDYIILDRCAGTGNLERKLSEEELGHCIVSTVEYYEYKVLQELIGAKVRHIVPPTEQSDTFNAGLVNGADALSKEYLEHPIIQSYLDDPKCTIILFENPPYKEFVSSDSQKVRENSGQKSSHVVQEMKKDEVLKREAKGQYARDIGNAFIWSAFKYYLRQPTDSYIVFSPVKYWKAQHLVKKKFVQGFAVNRKHFHTKTDACIMIAYWQNIEDHSCDRLELTAYDIQEGALVEYPEPLVVNRVNKSFAEPYFERGKMESDTPGLLASLDGTERQKGTLKPLYNEDIIGYLSVRGINFDNPDLNVSLLRMGRYDGGGFYLRRENYLEKLPMFAASRYITYNREWTERGRVMKSGDGSRQYFEAVASGELHQYLLRCLLFTTLEMQNHMRSFKGSDDRFYRNELCLDTSHGETLASQALKKLKYNQSEKDLIDQWENVLALAKQTEGYRSELSYGLYQIFAELDTFYKDETTGKTVWDNVELHSALVSLKEKVKRYYNTEIVENLFTYEFLK